MTKELVIIEFRYHDKPKYDRDSGSATKKITVGVFDTLDEAIVEGNKALEVFEKHFQIHKFPNGSEAKKDRFGKNNGCFGSANRLITQLAYLKTPFSFYAKIEKLTYGDLEQTILDVLDATKRYREYKLSEQEQ